MLPHLRDCLCDEAKCQAVWQKLEYWLGLRINCPHQDVLFFQVII